MGIGACATTGAFKLMADFKVPRPAPELVIALNSGEQLLLSSQKGKVVVLEFLLTTCPHCQRCSTAVQKVYDEMGGAFQPLGAATNPNDMAEARLLIPQYIYSLHLKFPVGWTNRDMAYQWLNADPAAGPVYFPQLVFIDKKGVIRAYHPGTDEEFFKDEENNIRRVVEALLKDAPPPQIGAKKAATK